MPIIVKQITTNAWEVWRGVPPFGYKLAQAQSKQAALAYCQQRGERPQRIIELETK